jgi:predicted metal-dependent hydrolase
MQVVTYLHFMATRADRIYLRTIFRICSVISQSTTSSDLQVRLVLRANPHSRYSWGVQLRFPWDAPPVGPPAAGAARQIVVDGHTFEVEIARHRRARRYVLRLTPEGALRLTVPARASISGGLRFAERQHNWIAREWRRQQERAAQWTDGTVLWFRGERVALEMSDREVRCGAESIRVRRAGDEDPVRTAVESHLRDLAAAELTPRALALAADCRVSVARIAVRNQRSRWGACSSQGTITLNWRLIQMPPSVSDYVIFHELMHRRQPNHSRKFWREVESVCTWWKEAERWLRKHGREIL